MLPPVPTDTRQAQTTMLYDLIEKSNPGFKVSYPVGSVVFGVPSAIAIKPEDPYKNDTTVRVTPAPGTTGFGGINVNYRRVDLSVRFKGMSLKITNWQSSNNMTSAVWVPFVAEKYGISVTTDDITAAGVNNNTNVQMAVKATSLCYKGTVTVNWSKTLQPLNLIITDANKALTGRLYPGGNDFTTPGRKPQGELQVYCQDASSIAAILETMPASVNPVAGSSYVQALVEFLLANTSRTDWSTAASSVSGGLLGIVWYKYTIPNATIPEANSGKYNRCIVIQAAAGSWFAGKLIIHYNV